MKLQEIFDQLATSEFSQLSLGGLNAGVIDEGNHPIIVNHVNLALTALYSRFRLKTGELTLRMQEGQRTYHMKSDYAVSNDASAEPVKYIIDTSVDPFLDDLIKIEEVLDEDGCPLPLNDASDLATLTTPRALVLKVPADLDVQDLTIHYRAKHPKIVIGASFDPATEEVELPDSHLAALLYYVASRANNPTGMANEFHAGNSYYAKYEAACQELEGQGLQIDQTETSTRALRGGWI